MRFKEFVYLGSTDEIRKSPGKVGDNAFTNGDMQWQSIQANVWKKLIKTLVFPIFLYRAGMWMLDAFEHAGRNRTVKQHLRGESSLLPWACCEKRWRIFRKIN